MLIKNIKLLDKEFNVREAMNVLIEGQYIKRIWNENSDNGRMCSTGEMAKATEHAGDMVIDGKDKFLMPAFYNTHCHVPMTLMRGYGEGLALQQWLKERIFPFESKFLAEYKYWGAKLGALELMKSGCVSISDMYFDLVAYGEALYEAGMKANLCNGLVCFDDDDSYYDNNAYFDTQKLLEWLKSHNDGRIIADASIHSEYATKEKAAMEAFEYAADMGMIVQVHVSETKSEHEECIARHGMTPIQYLKKCGAFDSPVVAAHCVWLEEEDVDIMRNSKACISHNISSNLKLGSGITPLKSYSDRGMNVTIGTDGAASNNNLNMLEEIHLTAAVCRGASLDANAVSAADVLKFATVNGAVAQGRKDCGLIEEGKKADFIILDLDSENMIPDYDTVANVVFSAQSSNIWMTVCDGNVICKNGESLLVDEEETKAKARESFYKVLETL